MTLSPPDALDLLDWKRRIFAVYADVRRAAAPEVAWGRWRDVRDEMFAHHPQSPLGKDARSLFSGLPMYPYEPGLRILAEIVPAPAERYDIATSGKDGGSYAFTRFAVARFALEDQTRALDLYWLEGYGGGLFVPFRDATSGKDTYGAGRYLFDTVKGADLGTQDGRLVLDFNFAYNPSCSYDPRWVCPLSPPANHLPIPIRAGERYR